MAHAQVATAPRARAIRGAPRKAPIARDEARNRHFRKKGQSQPSEVDFSRQSNQRGAFQQRGSTARGRATRNPTIATKDRGTGGHNSQDVERTDFQRRYQLLKKDREKERAEAIQNGFLADPDRPRSLSEAITPTGTCPDMCPEYERLERIIQKDIWSVELVQKDQESYTSRPPADEERMVKKFRRAAAGIDEQLPSDLRPPMVLKRTVDYLFDDLVESATSLSNVHHFVWDRTRAIRNDFSIQQVRSGLDLTLAVECYERIARFHMLSLHLLASESLPYQSYDTQQEREQLDKTLLSLMQYYEDSRGRQEHANEAEFRAYCIIFQIQDPVPDLEERIQNWPTRIVRDPRVQQALKLYTAACNTMDPQGPLRPRAPHPIAQGAWRKFWTILRSKQVSYLMGCVAETYFNLNRRTAINSIWGSYRQGAGRNTQEWPLTELLEPFGLANVDQVINFCQNYGLSVVSRDGVQYLDLDSGNGGRALPDPFIKQRFSDLVERKRYGRHISAVIRGMSVNQASQAGLLDEAAYTTTKVPGKSNENSLFVSDDSEDGSNAGRSQSSRVDQPRRDLGISSEARKAQSEPRSDGIHLPEATFSTQDNKGFGDLQPNDKTWKPDDGIKFDSSALLSQTAPSSSSTSLPSFIPFNDSAPSGRLKNPTTSDSTWKPSDGILFSSSRLASQTDQASASTSSPSFIPFNEPVNSPTFETQRAGAKVGETANNTQKQTTTEPITKMNWTTPSQVSPSTSFTATPSFASTPSPSHVQENAVSASSKLTNDSDSMKHTSSSFGIVDFNSQNDLSKGNLSQQAHVRRPTLLTNSSAPKQPSALRFEIANTNDEAAQETSNTSLAPTLSNSSLPGTTNKTLTANVSPSAAGSSVQNTPSNTATLFKTPFSSPFAQGTPVKNQDVSRAFSSTKAPSQSVNRAGSEETHLLSRNDLGSVQHPQSQPRALSAKETPQKIAKRRSQICRQLAHQLLMEQHGFLDQFIEFTTVPLIKEVQDQILDENFGREADALRIRLLSNRYGRRWRAICYKRRIARQGRQRRQRAAKMAQARRSLDRETSISAELEAFRRSLSSSRSSSGIPTPSNGSQTTSIIDNAKAESVQASPNVQSDTSIYVPTRHRQVALDDESHYGRPTKESDQRLSSRPQSSHSLRSSMAFGSSINKPYGQRYNTTRSTYFRQKAMGLQPASQSASSKSVGTRSPDRKRPRDVELDQLDSQPYKRPLKKAPIVANTDLKDSQHPASVPRHQARLSSSPAARKSAQEIHDEDEALFAAAREVRQAMRESMIFPNGEVPTDETEFRRKSQIQMLETEFRAVSNSSNGEVDAEQNVLRRKSLPPPKYRDRPSKFLPRDSYADRLTINGSKASDAQVNGNTTSTWPMTSKNDPQPQSAQTSRIVAQTSNTHNSFSLLDDDSTSALVNGRESPSISSAGSSFAGSVAESGRSEGHEFEQAAQIDQDEAEEYDDDDDYRPQASLQSASSWNGKGGTSMEDAIEL